MTAATDLASALAPALGPADGSIHTAIPPFRLGGGADVLRFLGAPVGGVVHVSAGLAEVAGQEIVLCTREPAPWAPPLVSQLAGALRHRPMVANGSVPLGDPDAPFAGLLFTYMPGVTPVTAGGRYTRFLLAVGVTGDELTACRSHGTPAVISLLRRAAVFPCSVPARPTAAGVAELGPSPRTCPGLSPHAAEGLAAVVDARSEDVESLRTRFSAEDLERLAAMYPRLPAFEQRVELVNLTQDSLDARLHPMWRAMLRDAVDQPLEPSTTEHAALAIALSGLDGSHRAFDAYFADLDHALAAARRRL